MTALIYRVLLRLCPAEFRERFGDEFMATARSAGPGAGRWRVVRDAATTVVGLRRDLRRERRAGTQSAVAHLGRDLKLAVRALRHAPGFTLSTVLTLTMGIAAFAIVYAIVDAMLLRPLPFGDRSNRLVTLHSTHPSQARDWDDSELSYADLMDLRERTTSFAGIEGVLGRNFSVATTDDAARVLGASVTPGLFDLLGVAPLHGRVFRADEGALPGLESVVVVSHALWTRVLGADPGIVGQPILLNARPVTVVGVMPEGFLFPEQHQLWLPYAGDRLAGRGNRSLIGVGLLQPGVSVTQAAQDAARVVDTLAAEYPQTNREWGVHLLSLRAYHIGDATGLASMLAAVVVLLLVTCANVSGLLIARGTSRATELMTRAALGASRGRLISLLLVEACVVAMMGGLCGVLLSIWGLKALLTLVAELPVYWATPVIDGRVLLAAVGATMGVAVLSGTLPAWRLSRVDTAASSATRVAGGTRSHRSTQRWLVVGQVALSLVLLVGATLLAASAVALQRADPGFDPTPLVSGRFYIAGDAYDDVRARAQAVSAVVARVAALPGVIAAAATQAIPADDGGPTVLVQPVSGTTPIGAMVFSTTPGLWTTLGLELKTGRTFSAQEHLDPDAAVAIVNERLASRLWPAQSAMDRSVAVVNARGEVINQLRVIGVAPNLVYEEFGDVPPQAELNIYVPYAMQGSRTMAVLARTMGDPALAAQPLRQAVRQVDGSFAAFDITSMEERRRVTTWGERFLATTFSGFAVVALLLACFGTYAVVSYAVAQRRREVGVRLALGATSTDVVTLFLSSSVTLCVVGLAIGIPMAVLAARGLESAGLLFGVSPWDVRLWTGLLGVLFSAVVVAALHPAVDAARVNPIEVLRH